jgi:ribulose-phosphate 3-epimerase
MELKIAPSILSAKRENLQEEVKDVECCADLIHVDVMDGKFVPPKTFEASEIKAIETKLMKDVHLMVAHPLKDGYIDSYIDAGAGIITVHVEMKDNVDECIRHIKSKGVKVGITLNPQTPLEDIIPYLDKVDMVLVMSVEPGYAGQKFIPSVLEKIRRLREIRPNMDIEIDGGIKRDTIKQAKDAGANIFVAGSAVFGKEDREIAIEELRLELQRKY